jgi:hypothetical protein
MTSQGRKQSQERRAEDSETLGMYMSSYRTGPLKDKEGLETWLRNCSWGHVTWE